MTPEHRERSAHDPASVHLGIELGRAFAAIERTLARIEHKLDLAHDLTPEGVAAFDAVARKLERLGGPTRPKPPQTQKEELPL